MRARHLVDPRIYERRDAGVVRCNPFHDPRLRVLPGFPEHAEAELPVNVVEESRSQKMAHVVADVGALRYRHPRHEVAAKAPVTDESTLRVTRSYTPLPRSLPVTS